MSFPHCCTILLQFLTAASSCAADLRSGRIPNGLILAGCAAAFVCDLAVFRQPGLLRFLGGLLPPLLLVPAFLVRGVGAGDIKLLMILGAFLGSAGSLRLLLLSLACGGVQALFTLWRTRRLTGRFRLSVSVLSGLCLFYALPAAGGSHG